MFVLETPSYAVLGFVAIIVGILLLWVAYKAFHAEIYEPGRPVNEGENIVSPLFPALFALALIYGGYWLISESIQII